MSGSRDVLGSPSEGSGEAGDSDGVTKYGCLIAPDQTWVLRGGFLSRNARSRNLRDVHEAYGIWGICVSAMPGSSPEIIAQIAAFGNKEAIMALSNELADEIGVTIIQEPGRNWPSALLAFENEPTDSDWNAVADVFGRRHPILNPRYQGPN